MHEELKTYQLNQKSKCRACVIYKYDFVYPPEHFLKTKKLSQNRTIQAQLENTFPRSNVFAQLH